jgi:hypothetical protein
MQLQFQYRTHDIQVSRITVDPVTGQRQRVMLGAIDRATFAILPTLKANCSSDDLAEIDRWLTCRQRLDQLRAELAARTLPEQIQLAGKWLADAESEEQARALANDIRANWQRLRGTLQQRKLL